MKELEEYILDMDKDLEEITDTMNQNNKAIQGFIDETSKILDEINAELIRIWIVVCFIVFIFFFISFSLRG